MASRPASSPCRAGVRLQGAGVVAGDRAQPALQVADQLGVARGVGRRRERVQPGELRPGDRLHLGGGVQLHRAGAERDHRPVERHVAVGQAAQVAQHRGLAVVRVEDRVGRGTSSRRARGDASPASRTVRRRSRGPPRLPPPKLRRSSAATTSRRCSRWSSRRRRPATASPSASRRLIPARGARRRGPRLARPGQATATRVEEGSSPTSDAVVAQVGGEGHACPCTRRGDRASARRGRGTRRTSRP